MKSKDEIIHELEQQVSDMAMEITRLKKIIELYEQVEEMQDKFIEHLSSRTKPKPFYDEIIEDYNKLGY